MKVFFFSTYSLQEDVEPYFKAYRTFTKMLNDSSIQLFLIFSSLFLESPELFGRIPGDIILFVASKRRRLEARNFAVIFFSL